MSKKLGFLTVAGLAVLALLFYSIQGGEGEAPAAEASAISGMGTLSGVVEAPESFQAAQVYAWHVDKNIVYMVFTHEGRYRAVNMFPGSYEVTVEKTGFEADVQQLEVRAGGNATADFSLRMVAAQTMTIGRGGPPSGGRSSDSAEQIARVPYDELYPPGPGREAVEKTCVYCHGVNFLPGQSRNESGWETAISMMESAERVNRGARVQAMIPEGSLSPEQREELLAYLAKHFGPGSQKRALRMEGELPLDEEALSKAMYVEFRLANEGEFTKRIAQEPNLDHDGNVWFTDRGTPSGLGRLDPRTGIVTNFMNPDPNGSPHGLVADTKGFVWWAGRNVHLGRIHPPTGEIVEYPVEQMGWHGHTPVLDSEENVWFTMLSGNRIGKWSRDTDQISLWEIPTAGGAPYGIDLDSEENIWFAEFRRCKVTKFEPATEKFTEYPALSQPCLIRRLGVDSKDTVWYGGFSNGKLGKLDPQTGKVVEYDMPMRFSQPYDVWPDNEDKIWITDAGPRAAIIRFDPDTEKFTYYPSPQWADMPKVAITREGAIWYSPRSSDIAAVGVLYPDVSKMTTLAAHF